MVAMAPAPTVGNDQATQALAVEDAAEALLEARQAATPPAAENASASADEDDDAPEEVTQDAARSATSGALQGERAGRASVQRARKEKRRSRAKARSNDASPKAGEEPSTQGAALPADVLERAAAAQERAKSESASSKPKPRKMIGKARGHTTERTVGKYRVVSTNEVTKRARRANGHGALQLMQSALDGDDRESASAVAHRGTRVAAKGNQRRSR